MWTSVISTVSYLRPGETICNSAGVPFPLPEPTVTELLERKPDTRSFLLYGRMIDQARAIKYTLPLLQDRGERVIEDISVQHIGPLRYKVSARYSTKVFQIHYPDSRSTANESPLPVEESGFTKTYTLFPKTTLLDWALRLGLVAALAWFAICKL